MTGSIKFQFNRLIQMVDNLANDLDFPIVSQIGHSEHSPKNHNFHRFTTTEFQDQLINDAEIIITHGGSSSLWKSVNSGNKLIVVPRLEKYGEHINDHQMFLSKK